MGRGYTTAWIASQPSISALGLAHSLGSVNVTIVTKLSKWWEPPLLPQRLNFGTFPGLQMWPRDKCQSWEPLQGLAQEGPDPSSSSGPQRPAATHTHLLGTGPEMRHCLAILLSNLRQTSGTLLYNSHAPCRVLKKPEPSTL